MRANDGTSEGKTESLYAGERGTAYYSQRQELRSLEVQRERAERFFLDVAGDEATILDFGCGNGMLLAQLAAAKRIGVEINADSLRDAAETLDVVTDDISSIPSDSVDVAISFHALEHVDAPATVVRELWRVLKPGGAARIVVPCEAPLANPDRRRWRPDDVTMHLFSWSPLTLGNLLTVCGFAVEDARLVPHSAGGRLGRMLPEGSPAGRWVAWGHLVRDPRLHTVVTARIPR